MKPAHIFLLFFFPANPLLAQIVPSFTGETLKNKTISIPEDTRGNYTFICFATSTKAQRELETWMDPVYNKFIAKTGVMDELYDVNIYFIPVFRGADAAMMETVKRRFNESAQEDVKGHVLFCKGDLSQVTEALGINDDHTPYFFLLNSEGKIIYQTSGIYSEEKFDAIDELIE